MWNHTTAIRLLHTAVVFLLQLLTCVHSLAYYTVSTINMRRGVRFERVCFFSQLWTNSGSRRALRWNREASCLPALSAESWEETTRWGCSRSRRKDSDWSNTRRFGRDRRSGLRVQLYLGEKCRPRNMYSLRRKKISACSFKTKTRTVNSGDSYVKRWQQRLFLSL